MSDSSSIGERVLDILKKYSGSDAGRSDLDVPLYESGILDSFGTVSVVLGLEETFGLTISPAELDTERWATPRLMIADVEGRLAAQSIGSR